MNRWDYLKIIVLYTLIQVVLYKSIILAIFIPLPLMILYHKYGRKIALISFILAFFLVALINQKINIYFAGFAGIGVVFAEIILRKYSLEKTFLLTLGGGLFLFFLALIPYSLSEGGPLNYIERKTLEVATQFSENVKERKEAYLKLGYSEKRIEQIINNPQKIAQKIMVELPSFIIILFMFSLWLNLIIFRKIMGEELFGNLNLWKIPEYFVWPTIVCGILLAFNMWVKLGGVAVFTLNIFKIILSFYFLQGIAILAFFFEYKNSAYFFQIIIYVILIVFLIFLIVGIGFFDIWIDFRKKIVNFPKTE